MDKDLDIAWTFETFGPNHYTYPNWYIAKGFVPPGGSYTSPPLLGYGIENSASSNAAFMGQISCNGSQPTPRWGDYMSTVWDPNFSSPSGESGAFWTVQEYTLSNANGSNQSTNWQALADPLPFFAGYSVPSSPAGTYDENECAISGATCHLIYSVPPNGQFGDLLLAEIEIGENANISYLSLPAGWVALGMANDHGYYA